MQGGFWRIGGGKMIVRGMVDVRGVFISGSVSLRTAVGHFAVHGTLDGTLTQRRLTVTGRLGAAPIHIRLVAT